VRCASEVEAEQAEGYLAVGDGGAAVAKAYEMSGGAPWLTVPENLSASQSWLPATNWTITVKQIKRKFSKKYVTSGAKLDGAVVTESAISFSSSADTVWRVRPAAVKRLSKQLWSLGEENDVAFNRIQGRRKLDLLKIRRKLSLVSMQYAEFSQGLQMFSGL
jgi:hypothetical protein